MTITVSGHSGTDITLSGSTLNADNELTFTSDNWDTPQTVTVTAAEDDDASADPAVTLAHAVSGTGPVTADDLEVTITGHGGGEHRPDSPDGSGGAYQRLHGGPGHSPADVTVTISGYSGTAVTLSSETLTFTADTWDQEQTVTLTAGSVSANTEVTLSHTVVGGGYDSVSADDVTVTVVDVSQNQTTIQVGVTLSGQTLTVPEGGSATYELVLGTQPSGDVTVTIVVEDTANNDVTTDEVSVLFTSQNWDQAQSVTVRAAHDDDAAADPVVSITHTVSDAEYAGVTVPGVEVTITEDDTAGVTISESSLTIGEGGSADYTVVLDTQPTADVTVTVSGHAGTDIALSGTTLNADNELTFTSDNWDTLQTVTVTASEDDDAAADPQVFLAHAVTGTGEYASVTADDLEVTITEKDEPVTVYFGKEFHYTVEGASGGAGVGAMLSAPLQKEVTIPLMVLSESTADIGDYTFVDFVSNPGLTFAPGETFAHVFVKPIIDMEDEDAETVVLGFGTLPTTWR